MHGSVVTLVVFRPWQRSGSGLQTPPGCPHPAGRSSGGCSCMCGCCSQTPCSTGRHKRWSPETQIVRRGGGLSGGPSRPEINYTLYCFSFLYISIWLSLIRQVKWRLYREGVSSVERHDPWPFLLTPLLLQETVEHHCVLREAGVKVKCYPRVEAQV